MKKQNYKKEIFRRAWHDYLEAQKHLNTEGRIFSHDDGKPFLSPWIAIRREAFDRMRATNWGK